MMVPFASTNSRLGAPRSKGRVSETWMGVRRGPSIRRSPQPSRPRS